MPLKGYTFDRIAPLGQNLLVTPSLCRKAHIVERFMRKRPALIKALCRITEARGKDVRVLWDDLVAQADGLSDEAVDALLAQYVGSEDDENDSDDDDMDVLIAEEDVTQDAEMARFMDRMKIAIDPPPNNLGGFDASAEFQDYQFDGMGGTAATTNLGRWETSFAASDQDAQPPSGSRPLVISKFADEDGGAAYSLSQVIDAIDTYPDPSLACVSAHTLGLALCRTGSLYLGRQLDNTLTTGSRVFEDLYGIVCANIRVIINTGAPALLLYRLIQHASNEQLEKLALSLSGLVCLSLRTSETSAVLERILARPSLSAGLADQLLNELVTSPDFVRTACHEIGSVALQATIRSLDPNTTPQLPRVLADTFVLRNLAINESGRFVIKALGQAYGCAAWQYVADDIDWFLHNERAAFILIVMCQDDSHRRFSPPRQPGRHLLFPYFIENTDDFLSSWGAEPMQYYLSSAANEKQHEEIHDVLEAAGDPAMVDMFVEACQDEFLPVIHFLIRAIKISRYRLGRGRVAINRLANTCAFRIQGVAPELSRMLERAVDGENVPYYRGRAGGPIRPKWHA